MEWKFVEMENDNNVDDRIATGRKKTISKAINAHLKVFLKEQRTIFYCFHFKMMFVEYQQNDPTFTEDTLTTDALRQQITHLCHTWDFSWRQKTHKHS
jgi:hypothetical protein